MSSPPLSSSLYPPARRPGAVESLCDIMITEPGGGEGGGEVGRQFLDHPGLLIGDQEPGRMVSLPEAGQTREPGRFEGVPDHLIENMIFLNPSHHFLLFLLLQTEWRLTGPRAGW